FLAASRYDILPMLPLNVAAAKLLGKTLEAVSREAAFGQARHDARGVYRRMVESGSLEGLESRLPRFGIQYYDFGDYHGKVDGSGHIVIRRSGVPAYIHDWYAPMQAAYVEEITRQLGASFAEAIPRPPIPMEPRGAFELCAIDTDVRYSR